MANINDYMNEEDREGLPDLQKVEEQAAAEAAPQGGGGFDLSFLQAKTGDGTVEDYLNHPMNFNGSKGLAQVLRGFTGLLGALDYAIIDIVMGGFRFMKERKNASTIPSH